MFKNTAGPVETMSLSAISRAIAIFVVLAIPAQTKLAVECPRGQFLQGETCLPVEVPENAELDVFGHGWQCKKGFKASGDLCIAMTPDELAEPKALNAALRAHLATQRAQAGASAPERTGEIEIALFGADGSAVAYISEDRTLYLWAGDPAAYLEPDGSEGFHVYGFNGKHLGWYVDGVVRDHNGRAVGTKREALGSAVKAEPFKAFKKFKPFKDFKEFAPFRPFFVNTWSPPYLDEFLMQGKE